MLLQLKFLPVVYAWAMPQKFQKIHNGTYLFLAQTILRKIENIQFWQASDCALQLRATPATVIWAHSPPKTYLPIVLSLKQITFTICDIQFSQSPKHVVASVPGWLDVQDSRIGKLIEQSVPFSKGLCVSYICKFFLYQPNEKQTNNRWFVQPNLGGDASQFFNLTLNWSLGIMFSMFSWWKFSQKCYWILLPLASKSSLPLKVHPNIFFRKFPNGISM